MIVQRGPYQVNVTDQRRYATGAGVLRGAQEAGELRKCAEDVRIREPETHEQLDRRRWRALGRRGDR